MDIRKLITVIYCLLLATSINKAQAQAAPDSTYLLTDMDVQLEASDGVQLMYNFKFDKAANQFRYLQLKFPEHPLPYFLLGLNEWWQIMPNFEDKSHDRRFVAFMDIAIDKAEKLYDKNENSKEALFFLAGAYGFKGRLYSDRKEWRKATFAGKNAVSYMNESRDLGESSLNPEFLFGDALYNYYAEWVPENYPWLRPIIAFFPGGDKALGLTQLIEVSRFAFYTRTEAQLFLIKIYANDLNQAEKAYPLAEYLANTFPDNAYFSRYHARLGFQTGNYQATAIESHEILAKIDSGYAGYEANSGRYASFYLGYLNRFVNKNNKEAAKYFQKCVDFAQSNESTESGYYLYSLNYLADIALDKGDTLQAVQYYEKVRDAKVKDNNAYKKATSFLKDNKKQIRQLSREQRR